MNWFQGRDDHSQISWESRDYASEDIEGEPISQRHENEEWNKKFNEAKRRGFKL